MCISCGAANVGFPHPKSEPSIGVSWRERYGLHAGEQVCGYYCMLLALWTTRLPPLKIGVIQYGEL